MNLSPKHLENFWCKVEKRGENDCWEWQGGTQSKGYGSFSINCKTYNAHRISFTIHNGYMPTLNVLHTCDNRRCVNPNHLWEGTQLDNVRDMHRKGRSNMSGLKYSGTLYSP